MILPSSKSTNDSSKISKPLLACSPVKVKEGMSLKTLPNRGEPKLSSSSYGPVAEFSFSGLKVNGTLLCIAVATSVLYRSIAMVIGPTPPGTGVT